MYDAIVIGARVAGSSTGMLLARKGYRVLVVDRASFPSDTISSHQIQLPGIARLKRWGLLEKVIASNAPATRQVRFDAGFTVLDGNYSEFEGIDALFSPRRIKLDKILLDAAREAGAEVRENFIMDEILFEGGQVNGIRGHTKNGGVISEKARIVIGADGKHSILARTVNAPQYNEKPPLSFAYYSYFSGVPLQGGEIYSLDRCMLGAWPTNDGLVMLFMARPIQEFHAFRSDVEKNFLQAIDLAPHLAERVHAGRREERIYGTADMPNFYRKPFGPGWALVGDACYVKDAITGQGISDAFSDAESLVQAIDAGLRGKQPLESCLAAHEKQRNARTYPMYEFTIGLASFAPATVEQKILFDALHENPQMTSRFLGMMTGTVPIAEFFNPRNLFDILGLSGMAKIMTARLRGKAKKPKGQALSLSA